MTDKKKVLLAFSGGADSCRAAELLLDQRYSVTALTMDMTGDAELLQKAEMQARERGLEWKSVDAIAIFREKVESYFASEYFNGRTPAPCTVCNAEIKWKLLYETAIREGYDHIATGHYMNIVEFEGRRYVSKAADERKDQSYYLWMLPQEMLQMALTPMAGQIKSDIKTEGHYRESMGVCFLNGGNYTDYLERRQCPGPGDIVDAAGKTIGRHDGIFRYTIGQKRGEGIPAGFCVTAIDAVSNRIVTGSNDDLFRSVLYISDWRFANKKEVLVANDITVKIRGIGVNPEGYCRLVFEGRLLKATLEQPAWAPAPGQPVVFYRGDRVVGGGFLAKSL